MATTEKTQVYACWDCGWECTLPDPLPDNPECDNCGGELEPKDAR